MTLGLTPKDFDNSGELTMIIKTAADQYVWIKVKR